MRLRVGIDLVAVDEVEEAVRVHSGRYLRRVYTRRELSDCASAAGTPDARRLAARFAAKEAAAKALGTGISHGVSWLEIEVGRQPGGRPILALSGRAAERAREMGVVRVSLSLTHSRETAMAVVVMEG